MKNSSYKFFQIKSGGAGIAAYRHNEAMNRIGLNSNMLVVLKMTRDNTNLCIA